MAEGRSPFDAQEVPEVATRLQQVADHLKPEAPPLARETAQRAAELLKWQRDWIVKLENVVRAFDPACTQAQPSVGKPPGFNLDQWWACYEFACSQEGIREVIQELRRKHKSS
jgi:hypothetical protein